MPQRAVPGSICATPQAPAVRSVALRYPLPKIPAGWVLDRSLTLDREQKHRQQDRGNVKESNEPTVRRFPREERAFLALHIGIPARPANHLHTFPVTSAKFLLPLRSDLDC